jgi:hypothetical protein
MTGLSEPALIWIKKSHMPPQETTFSAKALKLFEIYQQNVLFTKNHHRKAPPGAYPLGFIKTQREPQ